MAIKPEYLIDISMEDIGLDADILYKALLGEQCFCITDICPPPIDFSDTSWNIPVEESDTVASQRLEVAQLTNEDGTGAFDVVAQSVKNLILTEYDKGRITGAAYADTFVRLIEAALSNSTNFLLQKDLAYWQARKVYFDTWAARAQFELGKHQISLVQMQQLNQQIEFAAGKMRMMVLSEQYAGAMAQREVVIPKQAEMNDCQIELYEQQVTSYQRDAEVKAARIFTDAWITMKTMDEGLVAPDGFTNDRIDDVLKTLRDANGFDITP